MAYQSLLYHTLPPIIAAPIDLVGPPTLTMLVGSKEFDIADEMAPGRLAGGGDPPPPAVEADLSDTVVWVAIPGYLAACHATVAA